MSVRQVILGLLLFSAASSSHEANSRGRFADLVYGTPESMQLDGARIEYDGKDSIFVRFAGGHFTVAARAPSRIGVSPTKKHLVLNYGNGSGQIYDIAVYALPSGRSENVSGIKHKILTAAHSVKGCRATQQQISVLAEGWNDDGTLKIRTEDWTRKPGCDVIDRTWAFRLR